MQKPEFDPTRPRCIYLMPDQTLQCRYCDDDGGGEWKGLAPQGTRLGIVESEILNRLPTGE